MKAWLRISLVVLSIILLLCGVAASVEGPRGRPWKVSGSFYNWVEWPNTFGEFTGDLAGAGYNYFMTSISENGKSVQIVGESTLTLDDGDILLHEVFHSVQHDSVRCGIVQATVTGGTSQWAGNGGHLMYRGCWDNVTFTGEWTYKGQLLAQKLH